MTKKLGHGKSSIQVATKCLYDHVQPDDNGCWLWTRVPSYDGYGSVFFYNYGEPHYSYFVNLTGNKYRVQAHKLSHMLFNPHDPLTKEKPYVLHACDVKLCINPLHLSSGSAKQNAREKIERWVGPYPANNSVIPCIPTLYEQLLTGTSFRVLSEMYGCTMNTIRYHATQLETRENLILPQRKKFNQGENGTSL